jgi:hypothetical protein
MQVCKYIQPPFVPELEESEKNYFLFTRKTFEPKEKIKSFEKIKNSDMHLVYINLFDRGID